MSILPNSSLVSSSYFQKLIEKDNYEEMSVATCDFSNGLALEERFALAQINAAKTNQVMLRLIQGQVVASEEMSALRQEKVNLRQENAELRQANVEKNNRINSLEDDLYAPQKQSIISRINSIKRKLFLSSLIGMGKGGKIQTLKFLGKCAFVYVNPPAGIASLLSSEGSGMALKGKAQSELNAIERDVSEKPILMEDLEFKRNYETLIEHLKKEIRAFNGSGGSSRNPSNYEVNVERIINTRV